MTQNIINHIVLVLDASSSMAGKSAQELIKVADNQINHLATRSQDLNQETRITVYSFAASGFSGQRGLVDYTKCLIWDMDVLRVPSIAELYKPSGSTPLIDATLLAIDDLAETPQKYGDHSFLMYVLTDGQENASRATGQHLSQRFGELVDNWTVAAFVPDKSGENLAKRWGFPNVSVWDPTAEGVAEVGSIIRETTERYMVARGEARSKGTVFRGTKELFSLKEVSVGDIRNNLVALKTSEYNLIPVDAAEYVKPFVERHLGKYVHGNCYYQLSKREHIQEQKSIALATNDGKVHVGPDARGLLGLPATGTVKVDPSSHPDYAVFVQSTAPNRKLMPYTKLLVLT